ncbi:MAG: PASTA domain-containing protein [Armatimonadetes bacterium]|nr:PASTA domain-containing protein [Armatimonadota bacterium]
MLLPCAPGLVEASRETDGLLLVRDFVEGLSLEKWLLKRHAPAEVLSRGVEILQSVAAWHANGVVHGMLHPGNIILTHEGAVLTDYDQAAAVAQTFGVSVVRPDALVYVAPEVRAGRNARPGSDVYSVGVVLYEALTGRKLVPDAPERPKPSEVNKELSPGVDLVLEGMLKPEPDDRYPAAQAVEALSKLRELGEPQQRRSPRELRRQRARAREEQPRAPLPWGVTATLGFYRVLFTILGTILVSATTLSGLAYGTYRWLDESRPTEVIIPDVTGMTKDRAKTLFEQTLDLQFSVSVEQASKDVPAGAVIITQPGPGRKVRAGRVVQAILSSGPAQLTMPRLVTGTQSDALDQVQRLGLKQGIIQKQADDTIPDGYVIKQEPEAGRRVESGAQVNLWVSTGPDDKRRRGADAEQAKDPNAGKPLRKGKVRVTVPASDSICWVKIVVHDVNGEQIVYNKVHNAGDTVSRAVEGHGTTSVEVFLNDQLVQKKDL